MRHFVIFKESMFLSVIILTLVFLPSCKSRDNAPTFSGGAQSLEASQSGVWSGFFVQYDKKSEMSLDIKIENNSITGEGSDRVGNFVLNGDYDSQGNVEITKEYTGAHTLIYSGLYQDDLIKGEWRRYNPLDPTEYHSGAFEISWNP